MTLTVLFESLLHTSLYGLPVFGILWLARPFVRRGLGNPWTSALWLVLLFKLLWLVPLPSSWSFFNLLMRPPAGTPSWQTKVSLSDPPESASTPSTISGNLPSSNSTAADWIQSLVSMLWLVGASFFLLRLILQLKRASRLRSKSVWIPNCRLATLYENLPVSTGDVPCHVTHAVATPSVVGVFRPQILIPHSWLSQLNDLQLQQILLHELGHVRRLDVTVQGLWALACCLHWFNPFVWIAARLSRQDAELACDAWVLERLQKPEHSVYGSLLLQTLQLFRETPSSSPWIAAMAIQSSTLSQRIREIAAFRPHTFRRRIAGLLLLGGTVAILGTGPSSARENFPSETRSSPVTSPQSEEPTVTIEYKVLSAPVLQLQKLTADFHEIDPAVAASFKNSIANPSIALMGFFNKDQVQQILKTLNNTRGVDLLSAPRVTTKPDCTASISVIQAFRYPSSFRPNNSKTGKPIPVQYETRDLGITLKVTAGIPKLQTVDLDLLFEHSALLGFVKKGTSAAETDLLKLPPNNPDWNHVQPVFTTNKLKSNLQILSGHSAFLTLQPKDDPQMRYILIVTPIIQTPAPQKTASIY